MDPKLIHSISEKVYQRFPDLVGIKPMIRSHPSLKGENSSNKPAYLLTYSGEARVQGGKTIQRYVRVVANEDGKILKITTSR